MGGDLAMSDLISRLSELRCQCNCFDENERDAYHTLSEAIKALSDVPDTNAGDTISRQAAIEAINEDKIDLTKPTIAAFFKATGDFEKAETQAMTCDRHIKILKDLPSAQPERKKGEQKMKYRKKPVVVEAYQTDKEMIIHTLEGDMKASVGDYIITGVNGEQYPCKPDIFEKTYEKIDMV